MALWVDIGQAVGHERRQHHLEHGNQARWVLEHPVHHGVIVKSLGQNTDGPGQV